MSEIAPLIDRFSRKHSYLRISLTDRCNLRCTYCMPEEGIAWTPPQHILQANEIIRLATLFVHLGIRKIRLTGGEPMQRKDLAEIIQALAQIDGLQTLAMTTNAIGLDLKAAQLKKLGLQTLTISLDTLRRSRFLEITKRDRFNDVIAGIDAALDTGFLPLKINIVVMRGVNDDELLGFVDWAKDRPINLRFIEYMPFPDNHWSTGSLMPYGEMLSTIEGKYALIPKIAEASAVGKDFSVQDHLVTVSFVTSMTQSFCSTCNRVRLTADGNIKSCLFHPSETSLRDILRRGGSDEDLIAVIRKSIHEKQAAHAGLDELPSGDNRAMIAIGG
jgi:cyclic pyranopterin phosphate synthase